MRRLLLVSLVVLLLTASVVACGGGGQEPPPSFSPPDSLTVISRSSVDLLAANLESFRAFVSQVEAAIEERDIDFFAGNALASSLTCPSQPEPRCRGQPDGTVLEGIWLGPWPWRSEAGLLLTTQEFGDRLSEYLAAFPGAGVTAIAARVRKLDSAPTFFAVVSSPSDASHDARVFDFIRAQSGWRLRGLLLAQGDVAQTDWLSGNCADCYDYWELWQGEAP